MAKTLLDGVNQVLQRVGMVQSNSALSSLTDSSRQVGIDLAVRVFNEAIEDVYRLCDTPLPKAGGEATITLVAGQREYDLPADFLLPTWPLLNTTTGDIIREYPGGYDAMRIAQAVPSDYTGLPNGAAISPVSGKLRMDAEPTSAEAGMAYTLSYQKTSLLTLAADTVPFSDQAFFAIADVAANIWRRIRNQDFDPGLYRVALSRAGASIAQIQSRSRW